MKINEVVNQSLTQEQILLQENTLFRQVADWWAKTKDRLGYETPTADTIKLDKKIKHNERFTSTRDSIVGHLVWLYAQAYPEVKAKRLKTDFSIKFTQFKQVLRKKLAGIYQSGELDLAIIYALEHDKYSTRFDAGLSNPSKATVDDIIARGQTVPNRIDAKSNIFDYSNSYELVTE